jgi:hypothetical protein
MSRIPPTALRIACNTRHYECSGISSYYYTNQFIANLVLIQNLKSLSQQLVFPMTNHKLSDPNLAVQPSLFPVNTILKAKQNWYSKLQNHKPFFNSKTIGFACSFVFDHLKAPLLSQSVSAHGGGAKKRLLIESNYGKHVKKTHGGLLSFFSNNDSYAKLESSTHLQMNHYLNKVKKNAFKVKPSILNLERLKQIIANKQFQRTHSPFLFYLACNALVNQCVALPSSMFTRKQLTMGQTKLNSASVFNNSLRFESLDTISGLTNKHARDMGQTIQHGAGNVKCFISRSSDQIADLHMWHILPYNYVANTTNPGLKKNQVSSSLSVSAFTLTNSDSNRVRNNRLMFKESRVAGHNKAISILFNMYDSEKNSFYTSKQPSIVRF